MIPWPLVLLWTGLTVFAIVATLILSRAPKKIATAKWIYETRGRKASMDYMRSQGMTIYQARNAVDEFREKK